MAPKKIFTATDIYTLKAADGSRDLSFENGLAGLEQAFSRVRRLVLSQIEPIQPHNWQVILAFTAAMHNRTPQQIEHIRSQYERVLRGARDAEKHIREHGRSGVFPTISKSRPSYTLDEFAAIIADPVRRLTWPMIEAEFRALWSMYHGTILCTDDPVGFITSDSPVVWFVPDMHRRPPGLRIPALGLRNMEISMPLSPSQCLFLARKRFEHEYLDAPRSLVDMINHRTAQRSYETLVSSRPFVSEEWCEPPPLPPDAWEFTKEGQAALRRRRSTAD